MEELREKITRRLEQAEDDICAAENLVELHDLEKKTKADIFGAETAGLLSKSKANTWRSRVAQAAAFRQSSLMYKG